MATFSWKSSVDGTWNTAADWTLVGTPTGTPPPGNPPSVNIDTAIISKDDSTSYTVTLSQGTTFNIRFLWGNCGCLTEYSEPHV
jgi:hypothetical protein